MITVNDITAKLPKFDLPKLDLTNFDLSKVELPKIDTSKLDLPKLDLPKLDLPKVDLPSVDLARLTDLARDAAHVSVGAVVVGVQAVDERRRSVTEQISGQFRKVVGAAS